LQGLLVIFLLEVCRRNLYKIMYGLWILNH
jgi:hypothetical protein